MEQLYTFIQKTPNSQKTAFLGFLLVALGAAHYFLIFKGQSEQYQVLSGQLTRLEEELQQKQEIAANLAKFKNRVAYLQQKLEEKKKNLPDDANMDQLLRTLNELSEKSDMRITRFSPQPETQQAFFSEIPVRIGIEGNYHEIATFFDKVSKEDRIINISEIILGDPQSRNQKVVVKGSCLAKTFRASLPAAAVPGKGP